MRMKYSKFIYYIVTFLSMCALDYWRMLPISLGEYNVPIIVSWICVLLCIQTLSLGYNPSKQVRIFLFIVSTLLAVEVVNQTLLLGYGMDENLKVIVPYLYCFLTIPACYYIERKGFSKLLDRISCLSLGIVLMKIIGWIFYSIIGISIFPNLILKYSSEWMRNGNLRMETDCFFGLSFCYFLYRGINEGKKINYLFAVIYVLYTLFVSQSRGMLLNLILCLIIMLCFNKKRGMNKILIRIFIGLAILFALTSEAFNELLISFSTSNVVYGGSSIARLNCIVHYWNLMIERRAILGLGLLDTSCTHAISLMDNTYFSTGYWYSHYYLSDIGILGGFFRFGILSFLLYGYLLAIAIRAVKKTVREKKSYTYFIIGTFAYFVFNCFVFNIFEMTRAFAAPFYICIFDYVTKESSFKGNKS